MKLNKFYTYFFNKNFYKFVFLFLISFSLTSCGGLSKVDTRKTPIKGRDRAKQNVAEGKGVSIMGGLRGGGRTTYEFSTSNPLWRASLDILDFIPLSTVDYSGGLIISDWYNDTNNTKESLKITVRFLANDIKTNSLKIQVHKKICVNVGECRINILKSKITEELTKSILVKAVEIEKNTKSSKKKK